MAMPQSNEIVSIQNVRQFALAGALESGQHCRVLDGAIVSSRARPVFEDRQAQQASGLTILQPFFALSYLAEV